MWSADILTGPAVAAIWSEALGSTGHLSCEDTAACETNLRQAMPGWIAFDMRLIAERFAAESMLPGAGDVERLTTLLNRPLHSYREFAQRLAAGA